MQIQRQQCQIIHASLSLELSRGIQSGSTEMSTESFILRGQISNKLHSILSLSKQGEKLEISSET